MQTIRYIKSANIDNQKWDHCIDHAVNGLVYAYSWYLNAMSEQWDALVLNDYEAVLPLTWKKKWGFCYLYQPYFCAQLGIFSKVKPDSKLIKEFLTQIPSHFKYIDIYLNHSNLVQPAPVPMYQRSNYFLPLQNNYETISQGYRTNLKRNIKKAADSNLLIRDYIQPEEIIDLAKKTMQRVSPISDDELNRFRKVIESASNSNQLETIGIYSTKQQLLASAVFLYSHKRWYYILVGNHPNGKTIGASHYLLDRFIAKHAGTDAILDFEGSDIRNLAFFYSSYGAAEEFYPCLRWNRLPKIIRWMKN